MYRSMSLLSVGGKIYPEALVDTANLLGMFDVGGYQAYWYMDDLVLCSRVQENQREDRKFC